MKKSFKSIAFSALAFSMCSMFISCEHDQSDISQDNNLIESEKGFTEEQAFPDRTGEVVTIKLNGQSVKVEKINGQYIFGGDMIVTPDLPGQKSTGRTRGRWPNNTVYYEIESGLPNQARVTNAIAEWEAKTALRFVRRTNQSAYVYFRRGSGCSSSVGRTGRRQNINLANGCSTGNTVHEIGHAVGLWHEQSRKNRDQYITINFGNIQSNARFNFQTYTQQGNDGDEYTNALDFNSIMLYGSFAFSSNGQPTIVKKNGSTFSGQRRALSSGDIAGIKIMYPGNGGGGNDICAGVAPWSSSQSYQAGDLVTYQGSLYRKRSGNGWDRLGSCSTSRDSGKSVDGNASDLNDVSKD